MPGDAKQELFTAQQRLAQLGADLVQLRRDQ